MTKAIQYRDTHDFGRDELERLFLSVEWSSGHFPDKLVVAMKHFRTVFSAWDGDRLVGLICAMDDGIMNAYIHYLLVSPEYQGMGIGRTLVDMAKRKYADYLRVSVIAYDDERHFYENCGFRRAMVLLLCKSQLCGHKEHPHNAHVSLAGEFQPHAACNGMITSSTRRMQLRVFCR